MQSPPYTIPLGGDRRPEDYETLNPADALDSLAYDLGGSGFCYQPAAYGDRR